ncbi:cell division protein DamX [Phytobacter sp. V91]|uniref:cell division protein DamX n=1 Tax=Phytobacter sp. V91 TaxID=3369425 RepID=UPI003F5FF29F
MDEFKPEDDLKPDPADRRTGRSRQSSERVDEPQINFDDVDLEADDRRPARARKTRDERDDYEEEYEAQEGEFDEEHVERRPRKRKKAAAAKPASRQYVMMGVGILVLLLLIVGIGSALKAPSTSTADQAAPAEKNIDLSANSASPAAEQTNGVQPSPEAAPAADTAAGAPRDVSLPPISATPSQSQVSVTPEGQQRLEVQGDLNSALSSPQGQGQINNVVANSTLPTEPATVAPVRGGNGNAAHNAATQNSAAGTRTERKQMVIEPKPQPKPPVVKAEPKPVAPPVTQQPKRVETTVAAPVKAPMATAPVQAPAAKAPVVTAPAATAAAPAASAGATGNVGALKSAPGSHYTLQLSSSSNSTNLNAWAKKENLKNFVVYQTTRNGQPWYVLVSGVYASKEEAKRAVTALPSDVQAKNPWAKPLHQVQADLK